MAMRLPRNPNLFFSNNHLLHVAVLLNLTNTNNHLNYSGDKSGRPTVNLYGQKPRVFNTIF